jgi:tetratricopeptide (TPR) repeat protein
MKNKLIIKKRTKDIKNTKVKLLNLRLLIRGMLILIPIFFELFLRVIHYGRTYPLFIEDVWNKNYYRMNDEVSKRYFTFEQGALGMLNETFKKKKDANTFRIFFQGSSTTAGFPYNRGASFPRILKYRLDKTFPGKNIEIINTAITAVNSYTFLDLSDEIIKQKPDLVIIYPEHNEFYGALGVGSNQKYGNSPRLVNAFLRLKNLRIIQLINDLQLKVSMRSKKDEIIKKRTLMERMANDQKIPYNSKIYHQGIQQFEYNLDRLLQKYQKNNIPVFISTVVSKEKDLPPFVSQSLLSTKEYDQYIKNAQMSKEQKDTAQALIWYNKALTSDSLNAELHFEIANLYFAKGNFKFAKYHYLRAKDYDCLRFRSTEEVNRIIRYEAQKYNATLVDVKKEFENHSPGGILGNELLTEHVHPNIQGFFYMANMFYDAIKAKNMIGNWRNYIPADSIRSNLPITPIDSILAEIQLLRLKSLWPFKNNNTDIDPVLHLFKPKTIEQTYAFDLYLGKTIWLKANKELYMFYARNKEYDKALNIAEAMKLEFRTVGFPYTMSGDVFMAMKKFTQAIRDFQIAYSYSPNPEIAKKLGKLYFDANNFSKAEFYFNAFLVERNQDKFTQNLVVALHQVNILKDATLKNPNDIDSRLKLGILYYKIGKPLLSSEEITKTVDFAPNHPSVKEFLKEYAKFSSTH